MHYYFIHNSTCITFPQHVFVGRRPSVVSTDRELTSPHTSRLRLAPALLFSSTSGERTSTSSRCYAAMLHGLSTHTHALIASSAHRSASPHHTHQISRPPMRSRLPQARRSASPHCPLLDNHTSVPHLSSGSARASPHHTHQILRPPIKHSPWCFRVSRGTSALSSQTLKAAVGAISTAGAISTTGVISTAGATRALDVGEESPVRSVLDGESEVVTAYSLKM